MATQWLGAVPANPNPLAEALKQAQPAVSSYAEYLSKAPEREKEMANTVVEFAKTLVGTPELKEFENRVMNNTEVKQALQNHYPGFINTTEDGNQTFSVASELTRQPVSREGNKVVYRDTYGKMYTMDIPNAQDKDITVQGDKVVFVDRDTQEISVEPIGKYTVDKVTTNTYTDENGVEHTKTRLYNQHGEIVNEIEDVGTSVVMEQLGLEERKVSVLEKRLDLDKWVQEEQISISEQELALAKQQYKDTVKLELQKIKIDKRLADLQERIATSDDKFRKEQLEMEKAKLEEQAREFDTQLNQNKKEFAQTMAFSEDELEQKLALDRERLDLSNTQVFMDFWLEKEQLKVQKEMNEAQIRQLDANTNAIFADMQQYTDYVISDTQDGQITEVLGRRYDPQAGKFVYDKIEGLTPDVYELMLKQKQIEIALQETENTVYSGGSLEELAVVVPQLAAGDDLARTKIHMSDANNWDLALQNVIDKYIEHNPEYTIKDFPTLKGELLAHMTAMGTVPLDGNGFPYISASRQFTGSDEYAEQTKTAFKNTMFEVYGVKVPEKQSVSTPTYEPNIGLNLSKVIQKYNVQGRGGGSAQ
jgi:hypothetical protein